MQNSAPSFVVPENTDIELKQLQVQVRMHCRTLTSNPIDLICCVALDHIALDYIASHHMHGDDSAGLR